LKLLLDTHTALWFLSADDRLSGTARAHLMDGAHHVLLSAAVVWEIAIKRSLGKLDVPNDFPGTTMERGFAWLPVTSHHAWAVRDLPYHHRDPFDRLLIAQAQFERMTIVTSDPRFAAYGIDVRW
jgi:PIN domain nuclease of toxin-antitoxin system